MEKIDQQKILIDQVSFLKQHGWLIIQNAIPSSEVDQVVNDIKKYRASKFATTKDPLTHQGRIGVLHIELESLLKAVMNPSAVSIMKLFLNEDPILYGTLTFQVGTEQKLHHDAHFVRTIPSRNMIAIWVALEDIQMDAGAVYYLDESHLKYAEYDPSWSLRQHPTLLEEVLKFRKSGHDAKEYSKLANDVFDSWVLDLNEYLEMSTIAPEYALLKKGDVFMIHPYLLHGGSKVTNLNLTRKSIVGHFFSRSSRVWNRENSLLFDDELEKSKPLDLEIKSSKYGFYVNHPRSIFISPRMR